MPVAGVVEEPVSTSAVVDCTVVTVTGARVVTPPVTAPPSFVVDTAPVVAVVVVAAVVVVVVAAVVVVVVVVVVGSEHGGRLGGSSPPAKVKNSLPAGASSSLELPEPKDRLSTRCNVDTSALRVSTAWLSHGVSAGHMRVSAHCVTSAGPALC